MEFYDSKFDLGALSIAELSLQSANEVQDYGEYKRAIKFTLFFQPAFCVCWFLGVLAMETRHSVIMPIVFVVCYNILVPFIELNCSTEKACKPTTFQTRKIFLLFSPFFHYAHRTGTFCFDFTRSVH